MAINGGDLLEITCNHPTLGSTTFFVKSGEDFTVDLGGLKTDDSQEAIDSGGNAIYMLTRKRWSVEATLVWDMVSADRKELEKIHAYAGSPQEGEWTVEHLNGTVYGGTGKPVGDYAASGKDATIKLKLQGSGNLEEIA